MRQRECLQSAEFKFLLISRIFAIILTIVSKEEARQSTTVADNMPIKARVIKYLRKVSQNFTEAKRKNAINLMIMRNEELKAVNRDSRR